MGNLSGYYRCAGFKTCDQHSSYIDGDETKVFAKPVSILTSAPTPAPTLPPTPAPTPPPSNCGCNSYRDGASSRDSVVCMKKPLEQGKKICMPSDNSDCRSGEHEMCQLECPCKGGVCWCLYKPYNGSYIPTPAPTPPPTPAPTPPPSNCGCNSYRNGASSRDSVVCMQ